MVDISWKDQVLSPGLTQAGHRTNFPVVRMDHKAPILLILAAIRLAPAQMKSWNLLGVTQVLHPICAPSRAGPLDLSL
eukprot:5111827-Amphidinium_carterae.1